MADALHSRVMVLITDDTPNHGIAHGGCIQKVFPLSPWGVFYDAEGYPLNVQCEVVSQWKSQRHAFEKNEDDDA
jgi:hypothetical protein